MTDVAGPASPPATLPEWPQEVPVESQPLEAAPPPPPISGRTLGLWLEDEDCALLSEMVALARSQGLEPSEGQILRALLRVGLQHPGAIDQLRTLVERDGRELEHQT